MDVLYYPPWTRIGPYIVGIVVAYIFSRLNNKLTIERVIRKAFRWHRCGTCRCNDFIFQRKIVVLWLLGVACNLIVLLSLRDRHISVLSAAFYMALSRTVWAIGIGWILIACCTGHGGKFLPVGYSIQFE